METKTLPAPGAQAETSITAQMIAGIERLESFARPTEVVSISHTLYGKKSYTRTPFYATIGSGFYGVGATVEEAVDKCLASYGTADTRLEKAMSELKAKAAELGVEIVEAGK